MSNVQSCVIFKRLRSLCDKIRNKENDAITQARLHSLRHSVLLLCSSPFSASCRITSLCSMHVFFANAGFSSLR